MRVALGQEGKKEKQLGTSGRRLYIELGERSGARRDDEEQCDDVNGLGDINPLLSQVCLFTPDCFALAQSLFFFIVCFIMYREANLSDNIHGSSMEHRNMAFFLCFSNLASTCSSLSAPSILSGHDSLSHTVLYTCFGFTGGMLRQIDTLGFCEGFLELLCSFYMAYEMLNRHDNITSFRENCAKRFF